MFGKMYKNKKRYKYEAEILDFIAYNKKMAEVYKNANKDSFDSKEHLAIVKSYSESLLKKLPKKYNVSPALIKDLEKSEYTGLLEYDNLMNRIKGHNISEAKREKIDLYKTAIMELKDEGLI